LQIQQTASGKQVSKSTKQNERTPNSEVQVPDSHRSFEKKPNLVWFSLLLDQKNQTLSAQLEGMLQTYPRIVKLQRLIVLKFEQHQQVLRKLSQVQWLDTAGNWRSFSNGNVDGPDFGLVTLLQPKSDKHSWRWWLYTINLQGFKYIYILYIIYYIYILYIYINAF